eukprot:9361660-Lingulodinium_polyedra.AAC.1
MQHVVPMNAPVHDLVTEMRRPSLFRSDDPPRTAYDPTVPEGTESIARHVRACKHRPQRHIVRFVADS